MDKPKMPYNVYIPTIGYPIGKKTTDIDKIIKYAIGARRNARDAETQEYCNQILTDAYNAKYGDL